MWEMEKLRVNSYQHQEEAGVRTSLLLLKFKTREDWMEGRMEKIRGNRKQTWSFLSLCKL